MVRKPIFLDRDGVLNEDVAPYLSHLEYLRIFPWTEEALRLLWDAEFDIFVVSNQQGVALGITPVEELDKITEAIESCAKRAGARIRKFYHATQRDEDNHPWRKPSPGMILAARDEFGVDVEGAYLIGDKWSDIEAAARAGCRPLLVLSGVTPKEEDPNTWKYPPERVFPNLLEAVKAIIAE